MVSWGKGLLQDRLYNYIVYTYLLQNSMVIPEKGMVSEVLVEQNLAIEDPSFVLIAWPYPEAPPGSAEVQILELGFRSPFAGHYRYLAEALKLNMTLIPLEPDARGIASQDVKLADFQGAVQQITAFIAGSRSMADGDGVEL